MADQAITRTRPSLVRSGASTQPAASFPFTARSKAWTTRRRCSGGMRTSCQIRPQTSLQRQPPRARRSPLAKASLPSASVIMARTICRASARSSPPPASGRRRGSSASIRRRPLRLVPTFPRTSGRGIGGIVAWTDRGDGRFQPGWDVQETATSSSQHRPSRCDGPWQETRLPRPLSGRRGCAETGREQMTPPRTTGAPAGRWVARAGQVGELGDSAGDGRLRGPGEGARPPGPALVVEVARPSDSVTGGFDPPGTDQTNRSHSRLPLNPVTSLWPAAQPFRQIAPPSLPLAV